MTNSTGAKTTSKKPSTSASSEKAKAEREHVNLLKSRDSVKHSVRDKRHLVCPVCFSWVNSDHVFCYHCGQRLIAEKPSAQAAASSNITNISDVKPSEGSQPMADQA
jgi:hypothetical protein